MCTDRAVRKPIFPAPARLPMSLYYQISTQCKAHGGINLKVKRSALMGKLPMPLTLAAPAFTACPNFRAGVTVDIHRVWWGRHSCLPESASAGRSRPAERIRIGSGGQECPPLADSRQTRMSAPPSANGLSRKIGHARVHHLGRLDLRSTHGNLCLHKKLLV